MTDSQLLFHFFASPLRFIVDTVKMFMFFALCIVGTIFYPFYLLLNHQPVPVIYWIAALLVLMMVISISRSPLYTVFGGIGLAVTLALCIGNIPGFLEQVMVIYHPYRIYWLIFWFFFFGILKPWKRSKRPVVPIPVTPLRRSRSRRINSEPQYLPPMR